MNIDKTKYHLLLKMESIFKHFEENFVLINEQHYANTESESSSLDTLNWLRNEAGNCDAMPWRVGLQELVGKRKTQLGRSPGTLK